MEKKVNRPPYLVFLAVISLVALGGVFVYGLTKMKPKPSPGRSVLGETFESVKSGSSYGSIKESVQNTINTTVDSTKEIFTQKMTEVEKTVMESLNQEVANLTKSQVDSLKVQICRDLGVLPTVTPTP